MRATPIISVLNPEARQLTVLEESRGTFARVQSSLDSGKRDTKLLSVRDAQALVSRVEADSAAETVRVLFFDGAAVAALRRRRA